MRPYGSPRRRFVGTRPPKSASDSVNDPTRTVPLRRRALRKGTPPPGTYLTKLLGPIRRTLRCGPGSRGRAISTSRERSKHPSGSSPRRRRGCDRRPATVPSSPEERAGSRFAPSLPPWTRGSGRVGVRPGSCHRARRSTAGATRPGWPCATSDRCG